MGFFRGTLVLLSCSMLLACGAEPPVTGPPPEMWLAAPWAPTGKAVLSFCRPGRFMGGGLNTSVYVDRLEIADLDNGTLVHVVVDPGRHEVYSDEEEDALYLETEPGRQYFYRIVIDPGVWKGNGRLVQIPGEHGRVECAKLKRGKDIREPQLVVDPPR